MSKTRERRERKREGGRKKEANEKKTRKTHREENKIRNHNQITDNWGNRLLLEIYVTLNLKTWEVWNTKITNIQFLGGGGWGNGKK